MGALYNASPKIRGPSPQRNRGPKTCKIWRDFRQLQISIANISGTGQDIKIGQRCFTGDSSRIPGRKSGKLWSTNYRERYVSLDPPKLHFSGDYMSALRGCWPLKYHKQLLMVATNTCTNMYTSVYCVAVTVDIGYRWGLTGQPNVTTILHESNTFAAHI